MWRQPAARAPEQIALKKFAAVDGVAPQTIGDKDRVRVRRRRTHAEMKRSAAQSAFQAPGLIPRARVGPQGGRTTGPGLLAGRALRERNVDRHQLVRTPRRNRVPCPINPRGGRTEAPCQPCLNPSRLYEVRLSQWIRPDDAEMRQNVDCGCRVDVNCPTEPGRQKLVDDGLHDDWERLGRRGAQRDPSCVTDLWRAAGMNLVHQIVVDAFALRTNGNLRCFIQQAKYLRRHAIGDL